MAVQVSFPGVYIEEFAPGAPIQGVGTSTAAFIGPAERGDLDNPTKVTSWDQFRATFGEQPLPGFFLWYAVRGFFENGGQVCYIVRASNGTYAGLGLETPPTTALLDRAGNQLLIVRSREPGAPATSIQVQITGVNRLQVANTSLYQPTGTFTVTSIREANLANAAEAAQFRPGDWVTLGATDPRIQIVRVSGQTLRFASNLVATVGPPAATGTLRLADAPAGTRTVRILSSVPIPTEALVAGTMLTIAQGAAPPLATDSQIVESVQSEPLQTTPAITTYRVTFRQGLDTPFSLDPANPATVLSEEFNFQVSQGAGSTLYDNLSIDSAHPRYFANVVNTPTSLVRVSLVEPPASAAAPNNLPANVAAPGVPLAGGSNENLATLNAADYTAALDTLRVIDDVNLVAIPDAAMLGNNAATVQQAMIAHCELLGERFAVLDAQPGLELFGAASIETQRQGLDSTRGYAALYYPWLRVAPVGPGAPIVVPSSGHICGIFARSDSTRGVFKAPANEIVNGALGVERNMSDIDQGQLNLQGINVVRVFQGGGRPVLWGARTTATDRNWQYVNIRRLFLFLEESIQEGIRWAVFEPNNLGLWQKLKRTINAFLLQQWQDGALFGATPEEAFYTRIDEVLNPFSEQALGRLHVEIGVRPTYPAEFIIVRIGIWQGGSEVEES